MIKGRVGVVVNKRSDGLNARVLRPGLKGGFEEIGGSGAGVKRIIIGVTLTMRPAGFGDENGKSFLNAERADEIKFPLVAADAVTTSVGRATDKAMIGIGMRGKSIDVVKV